MHIATPVLGMLAASAAIALGQPAESEWKPPKIQSVLVVGPPGSGQRAVIQPNAVGASLVAGTWQSPKEGESLESSDGKALTWQSLTPDKEGWIRNQGFGRGGYAFVVVESDSDQQLLLTAKGSGFVIVNGAQRTGDPYGNGYVEVPVELKPGRNELLIRGGRGDVQLAFKRARQPAMLGADLTLPDVLVNEAGPYLGSILVANTTTDWLRGASLQVKPTTPNSGEQPVETPIDPVPPLGLAKSPFSFRASDSSASSIGYEVSIVCGGRTVDSKPFSVQVRKPTEQRLITFQSGIDGSIQYYALRPAIPADGNIKGLPLILSIHGAGVEGSGQAAAYSSKPWCNLIAATNRRPFGFDWEDWGRLDAIEVLDHATDLLNPDPRRVYLTGHSMGGHGTWQIGAHFAGRFAAIAPSAGWISFWSYSGAAAYEGGTPIENILRRAASPSDTLALKSNYLQQGVYILHGDADDNVPVDQARQMRKVLGEFHPDFAYYERPGAGHWWGNECVDWPPLMDFLRAHARPAAANTVRFTTSSPGVSAACDWVTIYSQTEQLKPSSIDLRVVSEPRSKGDEAERSGPSIATIRGTTGNVEALWLDIAAALRQLPADPARSTDELALQLDGQDLPLVKPMPASASLFLSRAGGSWSIVPQPPDSQKNPRRSGLFKSAFTNNVVLVVGTIGTDDENAWALAKARLDSETFWYRGNGRLRIVTDAEATTNSALAHCNLVLYGNSDTNSAWKTLLGDSPIQVSRGVLTAGQRRMSGEDMACLFIRPRSGDQVACVGAISGTGMTGFRLAGQVPYFVSGVGVPDWIVVGSEAMKTGVRGVRAAGFFDNRWSLSDADSAWSDSEPNTP